MRPRTLVLVGATLGAASVLMEWASYSNLSGGDAFQYLAPVSLKGIDYTQWIPVLALSSGVALCVLAADRLPKIAAILGSLALAAALLGVGIWLEIASKERAYERGFLVVAHNIVEVTNSDEDVGPEDIPTFERALALDHDELVKGMQVAPGNHIPLVAGLIGFLGSLSWFVRRKDDEALDRISVVLCGATIAAGSSLMVWLHFQASFPVESAFIVVDHPSFAGLDLLQGPLLMLVAGATFAMTLAGQYGKSFPPWLVLGAPVLLVALVISIFVTARSDALDEPLATPQGSEEVITLARLDEFTTDFGAEKLFTDLSRFRFELGSVAPLLGGGIALLGTFRPKKASPD